MVKRGFWGGKHSLPLLALETLSFTKHWNLEKCEWYKYILLTKTLTCLPLNIGTRNCTWLSSSSAFRRTLTSAGPRSSKMSASSPTCSQFSLWISKKHHIIVLCVFFLDFLKKHITHNFPCLSSSSPPSLCLFPSSAMNGNSIQFIQMHQNRHHVSFKSYI